MHMGCRWGPHVIHPEERASARAIETCEHARRRRRGTQESGNPFLEGKGRPAPHPAGHLDEADCGAGCGEDDERDEA